jgi:hypothetical protein
MEEGAVVYASEGENIWVLYLLVLDMLSRGLESRIFFPICENEKQSLVGHSTLGNIIASVPLCKYLLKISSISSKVV